MKEREKEKEEEKKEEKEGEKKEIIDFIIKLKILL